MAPVYVKPHLPFGKIRLQSFSFKWLYILINSNDKTTTSVTFKVYVKSDDKNYNVTAMTSHHDEDSDDANHHLMVWQEHFS